MSVVLIIHFWCVDSEFEPLTPSLVSLYTFEGEKLATSQILPFFYIMQAVSKLYDILPHICTIKCFVINCIVIVIKFADFWWDLKSDLKSGKLRPAEQDLMLTFTLCEVGR